MPERFCTKPPLCKGRCRVKTRRRDCKKTKFIAIQSLSQLRCQLPLHKGAFHTSIPALSFRLLSSSAIAPSLPRGYHVVFILQKAAGDLVAPAALFYLFLWIRCIKNASLFRFYPCDDAAPLSVLIAVTLSLGDHRITLVEVSELG